MPQAHQLKVQQLLKALYDSKLANYRFSGDSHPDVAAKFAVEGIVAQYKTERPEYLVQLLEEELEDSLKAGRQAKERMKGSNLFSGLF